MCTDIAHSKTGRSNAGESRNFGVVGCHVECVGVCSAREGAIVGLIESGGAALEVEAQSFALSSIEDAIIKNTTPRGAIACDTANIVYGTFNVVGHSDGTNGSDAIGFASISGGDIAVAVGIRLLLVAGVVAVVDGGRNAGTAGFAGHRVEVHILRSVVGILAAEETVGDVNLGTAIAPAYQTADTKVVCIVSVRITVSGIDDAAVKDTARKIVVGRFAVTNDATTEGLDSKCGRHKAVLNGVGAA